jgi:excisionase family DNA binding protein
VIPVAEDLTAEEVAARLRVPAETVQAWCRRGQLAGYKAGHFWRVPLAALDAFCAPAPPMPVAAPPRRRRRHRRASALDAHLKAVREQAAAMGLV